MRELAVAAVDVAPALEQLQDRPALCGGDGVHRSAARSVVVEAARASAVLPAAAPAAVELQHGAGASCRPALPPGRGPRGPAEPALTPASTRGGTPAVTPNALFPPTR